MTDSIFNELNFKLDCYLTNETCDVLKNTFFLLNQKVDTVYSVYVLYIPIHTGS